MANAIVTSDQDALFGMSADAETLAARLSDAIHTAHIEGAAALGQWEGAASQQFHAKLNDFTSLGFDLVEQLLSAAATLRQLGLQLAALDNVPLSMFGA